MKWLEKKLTCLATCLLIAVPVAALGAEDTPTVAGNAEAIKTVQVHADYLWTLIAAALVFFMQAGFAMVETGFTRAKNAVNILMKNLMDFSMGSITFWAIGFGLMFGATSTGWFGTSGFFLSDFGPGKDLWVLAFWMFQGCYANIFVVIAFQLDMESVVTPAQNKGCLVGAAPSDLADDRLRGVLTPIYKGFHPGFQCPCANQVKCAVRVRHLNQVIASIKLEGCMVPRRSGNRGGSDQAVLVPSELVRFPVAGREDVGVPVAVDVGGAERVA